MATPRVKICGVRQVQDALFAAEAGADYVGMAFVPGVRRRIEQSEALSITEGLREFGASSPLSVGLFADQPSQDVIDVIRGANLGCAQLCGDESSEYCQRIQDFAQVIKVLHVPIGADAGAIGAQMDAYAAAGCLVTLDTQVPGQHGGTGQVFDWSVAGRVSAAGRQFFLAGGLTPDNVAEAVAIAMPWAVDVSSGIETDGEKDHQKIEHFIANAKLGNLSTEVS